MAGPRRVTGHYSGSPGGGNSERGEVAGRRRGRDERELGEPERDAGRDDPRLAGCERAAAERDRGAFLGREEERAAVREEPRVDRRDAGRDDLEVRRRARAERRAPEEDEVLVARRVAAPPEMQRVD